MKKLFLPILAMLCMNVLAVNAADTTDFTTKTTKPNFEKMGPPTQGGNFTNKPAQPKGAPKAGQKPKKKPDSKPGGDRVPPEFMHNSNNSTSASTSK